MNLRSAPGTRHPGYPRTSQNRSDCGQGPADQAAPAAVRLAHEAPIAFAHEHGRLYDALEHAAQLAELAGHDSMAASLRRHRRHVGSEIAEASCDLSPRGLDDAEIAWLTARTIDELEADAEVADGG